MMLRIGLLMTETAEGKEEHLVMMPRTRPVMEIMAVRLQHRFVHQIDYPLKFLRLKVDINPSIIRFHCGIVFYFKNYQET